MPLAGQIIKALDFTEAQETDDPTDVSNIADVAFVAGSPVCSVTFIAPTSGKVMINLYARANADSSTNVLEVTYELRETDASGAIIVAANGARAMTFPLSSALSTATFSNTHQDIVTGLTPGAAYFAQTMHQVSGGSDIDIVHRKISAVPLPA